MLKGILFSKIGDPRTRRLVALIIDAGQGVLASEYDPVWFPADTLFDVCRARGLPIGNLTSQIWANCYLSAFDHFVKRELRCMGYVRYVDDFMLFADDTPTLWAWKAAIEDRLAALRLTIHPGAHPRPVGEGVPFLGFTVFPDLRRLKRRNAAHFARRLREAVADPELSQARLHAQVRGWMAHASHGNTVGLQKAILSRHGLDRAALVGIRLAVVAPVT